MTTIEYLFFSIWPILIILAWILIPITLILIIKAKGTVERKILNSILVIFVPIIGSIYVLITLKNCKNDHMM